MKITKLTPEDAALLPVVRDEWLAHGLSTEPANRQEAERGLRLAYEAAGLAPPRFMIWLGSPWAGVIGQALAGRVVADVFHRAQVRDQVDAQVRAHLDAQVRAQVDAQVDAQVYAQVYAQVRAQVDAQVRDQVDAQVYAQVYGWWRGLISGQYWAGYYAWLDAMERIGVEGLASIHGQQIVARNSSWWWAYRDFAILTERPTRLHRDAQGRLHNEFGPAMTWPDGWSIYAWHGTRVPADLIEVGWDNRRIFQEANAEIRRCAIERLGWDRFITESRLALVAEVDDPGNAPHKIALYDLPAELAGMFNEQARILLCTNGTVERDGTRRRFGLPVPAQHTDPVAAAAEMYDMPVAAYRHLEVRR